LETSNELSRPITAPLLTAVLGTCGVPAALLTAVLSRRHEITLIEELKEIRTAGHPVITTAEADQ